MNRFPTITSPLLRVATCVLGVLALAMALLLTSTGHADQQPASQPHAARATLTSYQQGAAGTRIAEGGTATRIAGPQQGWQCWHVFHYARAWYRVPIDGFQAPVDIGTLSTLLGSVTTDSTRSSIRTRPCTRMGAGRTTG